MPKEWRKMLFLVTAVALLASLSVAINVAASPSPAEPTVTVQMKGVRTRSTISYSVTIVNNTASPVGDIFVAADIPSGTTFSKVTATPTGFGFQGVQNGKAVFLGTSIAGNGKATLTYEVTMTAATAGAASAWVHILSPSEVTATSNQVTLAAATAAGAPRRGCLACHVLVAPDGRYTLPFEAHERAEVRGEEHPTVAPDGTSIKPTDMVGPETCLQCHAPGKGARQGMGVSAPLSLRDIVHPAHMFSPIFKEHYGGNCFTCHNVNGQGNFELIGKRMDVNDKGVPNKWPVIGLIPPSEGAK
jgi:hypothetical protein